MRRRLLRVLALMFVLVLELAACSAPAPVLDGNLAQQPEGASGRSEKVAGQGRQFLIATANPLASAAGQQILLAGGSALDAAIAVQMVLTLVEPQSSGIGGGGFLMHWDGQQVQAWDGRETAPAAAMETMFLAANGRPVPFAEAVRGGRAVATPGVLKVLQAAHRAHGRLPWARLFEPAITLADEGFLLSPRLHSLLMDAPGLRQDPQAGSYFFAGDGQPWPVGHRLKNPALAAVLRAIAQQGSDALYRGPIAADIVARVRGHAVPGRLSEADLAAYQPRQREALCANWPVRQSVYRVCGFPPPSSGQLAVMQILGMLAQRPEAAVQPSATTPGVPGAAWLHVYTEAARLAFADRALYVADPDFSPVPPGGYAALLQPAYLAQRAALIGPRALVEAPAGRPAGMPVASAMAPMPEQPEHGTSHVSIVDAQGHAVAFTTSIEAAFGAYVMADGGTGLPGGYLLNNQMTDFSLTPSDAQGRPVANRVQPGKRPRSSMNPTLVFDAQDGRLLLSLGSPGGPFIIHFTAKTLIATLQWGLDPQTAIAAPNFGTLGGPLLLETGLFSTATQDDLRARGHRVAEVVLTSGVQAVQRLPGGTRGAIPGWRGGADPRREGVVQGQ